MNLSMPRLSWTKSIEDPSLGGRVGCPRRKHCPASAEPRPAGIPRFSNRRRNTIANAFGLTLDGRIVPVGLPPAGSKRLVFTFSPGCPACGANQANWMSLASRLGQNGGVRVLWVSRDPIEITKEYCLKRGIPLSDILADRPIELIRNLGLAWVPNTLLVDASGVVEKVWTGCQAF